MKKFGVMIGCGIFLFALTLPAWAANTPDDAKALVEKAIDFYKANGKEKALAEFSKPKGQFVKGELYVFVIDPKGTTLAHGLEPRLVGQNLTDAKDADGKYFTREFVKIGTEGGWVDYKWTNYTTKKVAAKTAYLKRIDDMIIGSGAYK